MGATGNPKRLTDNHTNSHTIRRGSAPNGAVRGLAIQERLGLTPNPASPGKQNREWAEVAKLLHHLRHPSAQAEAHYLTIPPAPNWGSLLPTWITRAPGAVRTMHWITGSNQRHGTVDATWGYCRGGFPFCAELKAQWWPDRDDGLPPKPVILCNRFLRTVGALWWRERVKNWRPRWISALLYTLPRPDRRLVKDLLTQMDNSPSKKHSRSKTEQLAPTRITFPEHNLLQLGKTLAEHHLPNGGPGARSSPPEPDHLPLKLVDIGGAGHLFGLMPVHSHYPPASPYQHRENRINKGEQPDAESRQPQGCPVSQENLWHIWTEACKRTAPLRKLTSSLSILGREAALQDGETPPND